MHEWPAVLDRGVATRAMPGERRSGDRAVLVPYPGGALVGAIDGLGHGDDAADAAVLAERVLTAAPQGDPRALLERCHRALLRSRGAVMTLAWIDLAERTLRWTGVGNVEGRLVRAGEDPRAPTEGAFVRGGVVGYNLPDIRVTTTTLGPGDTIVLATDGVASNFGRAIAHGAGAQATADRILDAHAKGTDDALVVVVRFQPAA
ncbi:MAG TPA: SpoIIE family protein phosphatase [Solirubrobacteraceae bacterium]|nr:SpoIIE family protein phosphatase [Solirubrobacteraceae bacterium]